jgi:hypothetical protein
VPFGIQNNIYLVGTYRPQSVVAAGDGGSSPRAPYKYHALAVNAPKKMCLLGYKLTFAWWAHIAIRAECQSGGRGRRFFTVSAIQISSACGKRTKKDVPLGCKIIFAWWAHIALRAEWQPGTQVLHRERHTNIICLR